MEASCKVVDEKLHNRIIDAARPSVRSYYVVPIVFHGVAYCG